VHLAADEEKCLHSDEQYGRKVDIKDMWRIVQQDIESEYLGTNPEVGLID
jgi:hypothetical protein